jgi:uncharacterized membrane protein required for colicin V production
MKSLIDASTGVFGQMTMGWFDLVVAALLIFGIFRGRKRGMSVELLDVFRWLLIVVLCGQLYQPLGRYLADYTQITVLAGYVIAYLGIALFIKILFTWLKHAVGEKVVGSDIFGRLEFYLGMGAGALRFACMILFALALMNARFISDAQLKADAKMQKDNFGDISFPTFGSVQQDVFKNSLCGQLVKEHLSNQLIVPTAAANQTASRENIGKARERELNDVMNTKPKT